VIFDMDGVLIDSVSLNWQAMNIVLGHYDVQVDNQAIAKYVGKSLRDQVRELSSDYGLTLEYEPFESETSAIKKELFADVQPKEGVLHLLQELQTNKVPLAVATTSPRALTIERLTAARILDYFDALITENDVTKHKPDPEVYIAAATALTMPAKSCIVIEDAPSGIRAAKAAGMLCIAIKTDIVPNEQLRAADLAVNSLATLTFAQIRSLLHSR